MNEMNIKSLIASQLIHHILDIDPGKNSAGIVREMNGLYEITMNVNDT